MQISRQSRDCECVAPARERGLKLSDSKNIARRRSVAPARERGLKCLTHNLHYTQSSRSREGAWIEMVTLAICGRLLLVAPARERGLKLLQQLRHDTATTVAPARERGLK